MFVVFFFKQKTAYEMRISDWSSDVCSSDLLLQALDRPGFQRRCDSSFDRQSSARCSLQHGEIAGNKRGEHALLISEMLVNSGFRSVRACGDLIHVDRKSTRLNSSH